LPGQTPIGPRQAGPNPEVRVPARSDLERELENLINAWDPIGQLKALQKIRQIVDAWFDAAELVRVQAARSRNPQSRWREIGNALGVTEQHAARLFRDRLK